MAFRLPNTLLEHSVISSSFFMLSETHFQCVNLSHVETFQFARSVLLLNYVNRDKVPPSGFSGETVPPS